MDDRPWRVVYLERHISLCYPLKDKLAPCEPCQLGMPNESYSPSPLPETPTDFCSGACDDPILSTEDKGC